MRRFQVLWILCRQCMHASFWLVASSTLAQQAQITSPYSTVEITSPAPDFRQFNRVEITGSSIIRKEQVQALPVQVITREDIQRSGLKTVSDAVQALPSMGNFVESSQLGMVAGGFSNAAIHGMPNGTLVLVDGLRLAPFGRPSMAGPERSGTDLGNIPLSDVDRIEILTDGASSLYGADAIAGVINIILRKERKGLEISADHSRPHGGTGQAWVSSIGWGQGQLQRDGYSLLLTFEASKRQELLGIHRPYASSATYAFESGGQRYTSAPGPYYTIFTSPATLLRAATAQAPASYLNSKYVNGACTGTTLAFPGQNACFRNAYPSLGIYPEEESQRLHARSDFALGDGHTVFADLLLSRNQATQSNNWWPNTLSAYGLSPGSIAYQQAIAAGLDPRQTRLLWMPELPALRSASLQTSGRLLVGMEGDWKEWRYSSKAYLAQSRAQSLVDNFGDLNYNTLGLGWNQSWTNDLVLRPLDAGNLLTAQLELLRGGLKTASTGTTKLYGAQVQASRAIGEIEGKDVLLGMGLDLHTESSQFLNLTPPELTTEPSAFNVQRQVRSAHAELQIPITPVWEINLGARSDQYSDVGTTNNAKLFSRWEISPEWSMRGSFGSGFRAPNPAQTHANATTYVWGQSSLLLECNAQQQAITNQLDAGTGTASCRAGSNPYVLGNGNPELKPERSQQLTWGLAFAPQRNLRLSADFWAVRIRDKIQFLTDDSVLNNPLRYAVNYALTPISANTGTTPGALALYLPLMNLGQSEKSGIDFEAQWRKPGEWGRWSLTGQATYLLRSRNKSTADDPFASDLGQYDANTSTVSPRFRSHIVAGLSGSDLAVFLTMNHTSSYQDAPIMATRLTDGVKENVTRKVASFSTWDLKILHAVTKQIDLRVGLRNLLNQQAPLSFVQTSSQIYGANTVYSNLWGRTLDLGITMRF